MISDARQARVSGFALTAAACPRFDEATVDWFAESIVAAEGPHDARHNPNYSFGTQDAIDAERVPVA
jgi:hypothetical protein